MSDENTERVRREILKPHVTNPGSKPKEGMRMKKFPLANPLKRIAITKGGKKFILTRGRFIPVGKKQAARPKPRRRG
ncbi:MAG TPA: hypothetical protein VJG83_03725 [archaeon]|nr:hypothetical protein [archaeon]